MIVVLLANGFEEIEALTPVDMLRRSGFDVKTVGVTGKIAIGSHGIPVVCDLEASALKLDEITMAIFPGGMPGSLNLDAALLTDEVITSVTSRGGRLAAICAAPLVFGRRGLLDGKRATCFPGFENELRGAVCTGTAVVTDGLITTARDMTVSLEFANEIVSLLKKDAENNMPELPEKEAESEISFGNLVFEPIEDEESGNAEYSAPSLEPLKKDAPTEDCSEQYEIQRNAEKIINILDSFDVMATIRGVDRGPRLTRYEVVPARGVKVSKILNLQDDLALGIAAGNIRIEAPIPGKSAIGIEIPNRVPKVVRLGSLIDSSEFKSNESPTAVCIGRDITGAPVYGDIATMPHLIIAGSVGMGKSVLVHSLIASIISKACPDEVKFIMIDPKHVELSAYNKTPHLLMPVISDCRLSVGALSWANDEMERRYELLSTLGVRNIDAYNKKVKAEPMLGSTLPKIIIVIDELADLMLQVRDPVENLVMRIAQKARAAGIHLIIGTQRPTTNVITGTIKANIGTRISCKVASNVDSRTVLDMSGAERLLDKGDMLYSRIGSEAPIRVQGAFISDDELDDMLYELKKFGAGYDKYIMKAVETAAAKYMPVTVDEDDDAEDEEGDYLTDKQFLNAVDVAIESGKISTALIQRKLAIGYGKAAKFLDIMEDMGIISEADGHRPRKVLLTKEEWKEKLARLSMD